MKVDASWIVRILQPFGKESIFLEGPVPRFDEVEGCLIADRGNVRRRVDNIGAKKRATGRDLYRGLLKARRHIDRHFAERLELCELARIAGQSRAEFVRNFSKAFSVSPHAYIMARRMAAARHLLATTLLPITEIAMQVGYESLGYFTTLFKREHGETPSRFRERSSCPNG